MEVQARRRGRRTYYYLTQSYRERGQVRKIEWYLGRKLPKDLAEKKSQWRLDFLVRQWASALDQVGRSHQKNWAKTPASVREKELETFAVRFTYDTNRIEGSSLTFHETASLLMDGVTPSHRPMSDVRESLAHRQVFLGALHSDTQLDLETILRWHRELFSETKPRLAGQVRSYRVGISGSQFEPPLPIELDLLLDEFFRWYRAVEKTLHPVILAALVHYRLVSIHPFGDGNGRVTRLAMNFVLHRKRFPMFDIPYVGRSSYYSSLERSHSARDEGIFVRWFVKRYLKENTRRVSDRVRPTRGGA